MSLITIITPVAPYHLDRLDAVRATVAAQTVPCRHILVVDRAGRGPGHARNVGLRRTESEFVVFLDADDWLEPTFVERCLTAFDGQRYVYTDWRQGAERKDAPCAPWTNRTWHCITTLLPTAWAREMGGFDEDLPGGEDTAFYLKLTTAGRCGKRLAEPLFHYGKDGRRANAFVNGPQFALIMKQLTERYGGKRMACGDCGELPQDIQPLGDRGPGDVLVQATWGGNRRERGSMTGRIYPRAGNGAQLWVDPRDADAAPQLFRRAPAALPTPARVSDDAQYSVEVIDAETEEPLTDVEAVARAMFPGLQAAPPDLSAAPLPPGAKPDIQKLRRKMRRLENGALP
jgi:hypothetical protein